MFNDEERGQIAMAIIILAGLFLYCLTSWTTATLVVSGLVVLGWLIEKLPAPPSTEQRFLRRRQTLVSLMARQQGRQDNQKSAAAEVTRLEAFLAQENLPGDLRQQLEARLRSARSAAALAAFEVDATDTDIALARTKYEQSGRDMEDLRRQHALLALSKQRRTVCKA